MEFETVPEGKDHNENFKKACAIMEDRNKVIAELFGVEKKEPNVLFFHSTGGLTQKLHSQEKEFKGYVDGSEEVLLVHPDAVDGLFPDLWKEMNILADHVLIKYYLCKLYFPNKEDYKLYYKYISEQLALVVSGGYQESVAKFELKFYTRGKKLRKEPAVGLLLYIMKKYSGIQFIFENLDKIMQECNIEKSVSEIYNKSIDELLIPEKEKIIAEERAKQEQEKAKRQAAFNAQRKNYSTNNARRPGQKSNAEKKFVTRDKFKTNQSNNDSQKSNPQKNHKKPTQSNQNQQKEQSRFGYSKKFNN